MPDEVELDGAVRADRHQRSTDELDDLGFGVGMLEGLLEREFDVAPLLELRAFALDCVQPRVELSARRAFATYQPPRDERDDDRRQAEDADR